MPKYKLSVEKRAVKVARMEQLIDLCQIWRSEVWRTSIRYSMR